MYLDLTDALFTADARNNAVTPHAEYRDDLLRLAGAVSGFDGDTARGVIYDRFGGFLMRRCEKPSLYIVGGAVRNALLNLPVGDYDVASRLLPGDIEKIAQSLGIEYVPKGVKYGAVELRFPSGLTVEHTTFRHDEYGGDGAHRPESVRFTGDMLTDALRRDFSANALYYDPLKCELFDPTGRGYADTLSRTLRTTTEDAGKILGNDGVRILRLARFCAELNFAPDEAALLAAKESVSLIKSLSAERIRSELDRLLLADAAYSDEEAGFSPSPAEPWKNRCYIALSLLKSIGALELIFPELPPSGVKFSEDRLRLPIHEKLLRTSALMPPKLHLRLAGLFHDIGRAHINDPRHLDHVRHPKLGAEIAEGALSRLGYDKSAVRSVKRLVELHAFDAFGRLDEAHLRRRFANFGRELSEGLCLLRSAADRAERRCDSSPAVRWRRVYDQMVSENAPFSVGELNCTGDDVMQFLGIPPSRRVADILHALLEHAAQHPGDNTKERLLELARNKL